MEIRLEIATWALIPCEIDYISISAQGLYQTAQAVSAGFLFAGRCSKLLIHDGTEGVASEHCEAVKTIR